MERLGVQDLAPLRGDDAGWPWDIGAIAILGGTGLTDRDGRFRIEAVRSARRTTAPAPKPSPPSTRSARTWPDSGSTPAECCSKPAARENRNP